MSGLGVGEEDDVVGPLADEQGVLDGGGVGAEHAEWLVTNLPAVAVGAVEEVPAPSFTDAGDVGQVVADAGGDQNATGASRAVPLARRMTNRDRRDWTLVVDELDAVAE